MAEKRPDPIDDPELEIRIDALAEAYLDQLQQGHPPDRQVLLDSNPDIADTLDCHLRLVEMMHGAQDLEEATPGSILAPTPPPDPGEVPERVGPYRIRETLGAGGMGEVYLAEQEGPIRRQVALKLIKLGMDTREVVARFRTEQQALALMDHPHIARVFDAGSSERGRPFFVMEYVPGDPITDFCDKERLDLRARLDLFLQVCEAVQHAHQKGVIHRDLKPTNLLVSAADGTFTPKIIDFGVAKATNRRLAERTAFTELGRVIGTPEYMSPEQADAERGDVDTRSDIYSLGAILYELLAGALPFDGKRLRSLPYDEIRRTIREQAPPRPSTRLSTLGESRPEVARRRRTDPRSLERLLHGDLDWIILKALDKDPDRRYPSASELAADIIRCRNHEPVLACPPSALYRTRKFVQKHRRAAVAAATVSLALIGGGTFSAAMWLRADAARLAEESHRQEAEKQGEIALQALAQAQSETDKAEAIKDFLAEMLMAAHPGREGRDVRVAEVLQAAEEEIEGSFPEQPDVEAELREVVGLTYSGLGLGRAAASQLEAALRLLLDLFGEAHPETADTRLNLASVYRELGRLEEARTLCQVASEVWGDPDSEDPLTLRCWIEMAKVQTELGELEEAERLCRMALETQHRLHGEENVQSVAWSNQLSYILTDRGRLQEAAQILKPLCERARRLLGEDHPQTLSTRSNYAHTLRMLGNVEASAEARQQVLVELERVLGEDHPSTLRAMQNLASLLMDLGKLEESERVYREVLRRAEASLGPEDPLVEMVTHNLALTLAKLEEHTEAEALLWKVLEATRSRFGAEHSNTLTVMNSLAFVMNDAGKHAEAEPIFRRVLAIQKRTLGRGHPACLHTMGNLASCLDDLDRFEEALDLQRQAMEGFRESLGQANSITLTCMDGFAMMLGKVGQLEEAVKVARRVHEISQKALPRGSLKRIRFRRNYGVTLLEAGRPEEAEPHIREAYERLKALGDAPDSDLLNTLLFLRQTYRNMGKPEEGERYTELIEALRAGPPEE